MKKFAVALFFTTLIGCIWNMLNCLWLFRWIYAAEPAPIFRQETLACDSGWTSVVIITKLITGAIYIIAYKIIQRAIPFEGIKKGLFFGFFLWFTGWVPTMLTEFPILKASALFLAYILLDFLGLFLLIGMMINYIYESRPDKR